jgi:Domain of unknown function (DUF4136)
MKALHLRPTLSALGNGVAHFSKYFKALDHMGIAQVATYLIASLALASLSACSGLSLVDSEVSAFSTLSALPANATYRFERLPSQQSVGERQAKLEGVAQAALAKAGLQRAPDTAQAVPYTVQIGARTQRFDRAPWGDFAMGLPGRDYVVTGNGQVIYMPPFPRADLPYYQRELSLLLREVATGKVVFEAHAKHDGRWADGDAVLPAMFDAALQGFPVPPAGPRRVNIEIAR